MLKTLRITSVAAVLAACGFLIFFAVFGIRSDPKAEEFLRLPNAVEKFSKEQTQQSSKTDAQSTPLVRQAQAFGLYLNPPKPEPKPEDLEGSRVARPEVVAPKFTLIGTSFSAAHPELSLALIDEPGKGLHWVKRSSKIDHLVIEQIKDGSVVVSDGSRTFDIVAQRPEKVSFLKPSPTTKVVTLPAATAPTEAVALPSQPAEESQEQIDREEIMVFEMLNKELAAIDADVQSGRLDPNAAEEKRDILISKYMSDTEAMRARVSAKEAEDLDRLGQQLQSKQEPNSIRPPVARPVETPRTVSPKLESKSQTTTSSTKTTPATPRQRNPRRRTVRSRSTDSNSR